MGVGRTAGGRYDVFIAIFVDIATDHFAAVHPGGENIPVPKSPAAFPYNTRMPLPVTGDNEIRKTIFR